MICKKWEENIFKIPKLSNRHVEVEPCVLSFMSLVLLLRSGILSIQIEVERWANTNVE